MSTFTTVTRPIDRDRWGRPLITPPNGGKAVAYTRATTLAGAIEDLNGLIKWKVGRAILGIVERPDLLLAAAAHRDDKQRLNQIAEDAAEAGGASAGATIGTAVHAFIEKINHGLPTGTIPSDYKADVTAYEQAMANLTPIHVEQMVVLDDLKVAGTPDLIASYGGGNYICDVKTGSIDYPHKMAAQLAIYANAQLYDPSSGRRTPLPDVNRERAIIIHLPAGAGTCTLQWIDIAAGWEAVKLALQVRDWRARKGLLTPLGEFDTAIAVLTAAGITTEPVDPVLDAIERATSLQRLTELWQQHKSVWTTAHTSAAANRKAQLSA